jgi:hypothetical protein
MYFILSPSFSLSVKAANVHDFCKCMVRKQFSLNVNSAEIFVLCFFLHIFCFFGIFIQVVCSADQ